MASEIFADTSGLYALLVSADDCHTRACAVLAAAAKRKTRFVVTDYVIDETATLLRARGHGSATEDLFETVLSSRACSIEWMERDRFDRARTLFLAHGDKEWSFTDCFSFVVMKELRIRDALTKDRHFSAAGFHALLG
jgi:uncharacterized protein